MTLSIFRASSTETTQTAQVTYINDIHDKEIEKEKRRRHCCTSFPGILQEYSWEEKSVRAS
jgi:hypothetical protein